MLRLAQLLPRTTSRQPVAAPAEALPLAVLEFQSPTAAIIATPIPVSAAHTNYVVSALVICIIITAFVMHTDQLVVASGEIVSASADSSIEAFNASSIVESIKVHPGEIVKRGQVLATLNPTYTAAALTSLTQQEQLYSAQVAQLQAQENGKPYVPDPSNPQSVLQLQTYNQAVGQYNYTMQDYTQKIAGLQQQINGYENDVANDSQRLVYAKQVLSMREKLEALQVGSHVDTLAAQDAVSAMETNLSDAQSSAAANQKQLASQEAERDGFAQQWRLQTSQELATALNNLSQAQQNLAQAQLDNQLVNLTAPRDSIVNSIASVSVGSVLQPGQELMDLVPLNTPLSVEADVDGAECGFVQVGDPVDIKFQTFDYLQYGKARGTVISISPESFNPNDQSTAATFGPALPGGPQDLYYKAEISLDVVNLHNIQTGFQLVPGMPVEADMKVGQTTLIHFFFRKMMPIAYESMHEP